MRLHLCHTAVIEIGVCILPIFNHSLKWPSYQRNGNSVNLDIKSIWTSITTFCSLNYQRILLFRKNLNVSLNHFKNCCRRFALPNYHLCYCILATKSLEVRGNHLISYEVNSFNNSEISNHMAVWPLQK